MKYNLVDLLSEEDSLTGSDGSESFKLDKRRKFYLPLASFTFGHIDHTRTQNVPSFIFEPWDSESIPSNQHAFNIDIIQKNGYTFSDEGNLPDPAIRIHAVTKGRVWYQKAEGNIPASMILETPVFYNPCNIVPYAKWWERWFEAKCIPAYIIYENIDPDFLLDILSSLRTNTPHPPQGIMQCQAVTRTSTIKASHQYMYHPEWEITTEFSETNIECSSIDRANKHYGLSFPADVFDGNKQEFISQFMSGNMTTFILAEPGSLLGKAAKIPNPADADDPQSRRLTLKVRYHDDTEAEPRLMNPRELLYLLFGASTGEYGGSLEATGSSSTAAHPLLKRMNDKGLNEQDDIKLETKRMLLRPPLRTHARVQWESCWETNYHALEWDYSKVNSQYISVDRLYNTLEDFLHVPFKFAKCVWFVCEMSLRSGYRVRIFRNKSNIWYYKWTNPKPYFEQKGYTDYEWKSDITSNNNYVTENSNILQDIDGLCYGAPYKFAPLLSAQSTGSILWGRKWIKRFSDLPVEDVNNEINQMIQEEGRCFIVLRSRKNTSGHMILLDKMIDHSTAYGPFPYWMQADNNETVLKMFKCDYFHASTYNGAEKKEDETFFPDGINDEQNRENPIFLVELVPGRDPDTDYGLEDLNVE